MFLRSACEYVDSARVQIGPEISGRDVHRLVRDARVEVVQTREPLPGHLWDRLNAELFSRRPDIKLRVYGFYGTSCDLSFASRMTNVRRFSADCLVEASNLDSIAEIPHLEMLALGIFELRDLSVLESVSPNLISLGLTATRSKKPDLAVIRRFPGLRELFIEGHTKNIGVISELRELEDLTLRSITTPDVSYLSPLRNLWSLDIKLGGIKSFDGLRGMSNIKYLELWQVMGLEDVSFISDLRGLQNLFLEAITRLKAIPSLRDSVCLRRVTVSTMKSLQDFSELEWAPALQEFGLGGNSQEPEQLLPVLRNPNVRRIAAGFGSDRKNRQFDDLRREFRRDEFDWSSPFEYL